MVAVQPSIPSEHAFLYELVPSSDLPAVDFSQSLKSRYLPVSVLQAVDAFLLRWKYALAVAYAASLLLTSTMLYIEAPAERFTAELTLVLGLPLGLGGLGALRVEMVRLLIREDSVIFFVLLNVATQVLTVILLGDLRGLYLVNYAVGFINVVLIDARLRAVRTFTRLCMVAAFVVSACLVAFLLDCVDKANNRTLWKYQEGLTLYDVCLSEYVTTGLFTLLILEVKILYRKHQSLRDSSVISCVMFHCRIKLVAVASSSERNGPCLQDHLKADSTNPVQQLKLVQSGRIFDARKTVLSVGTLSSAKAFPWFFLVVLYSLGAGGAAMLFTSPYYGNVSDKSPAYAAAIMAIFTSSLAFWLVFVACYQRELLRLLVFSFDFLFYSFQITTVLLADASLGQWERNQCLWLLTNWIWSHWIFCIDALTPMMRAKLRFRVWYAIPILFMQLLGDVKLLYLLTAQTQSIPENSVLWSGEVLGRHVKLHLLPFLVSRTLLATTWSIRLMMRLCRASNSDAIIMKGTVSYANYMSRSASTPSTKLRIKSGIRPMISKLQLPTA